LAEDYMLSNSEHIAFAGRLAATVDVPVMADGRDGGANPLHVYRAIREYERLGVAGVFIDDGDSARPSVEAMADKIRAAVDARQDQNLMIMARVEAMRRKEPIERALERGVAYAAAGADALCFLGLPVAEHSRVAAAVKRPLVGDGIPGAIGDMKPNKIDMQLVSSFYRVVLGTMQHAIREMKSGVITSKDLLQAAIEPDVFRRITGTQDHEERARKYHVVR
jgi:2-methylisocitrate lyase-like PEP mutase family enzyme